jgi:NTF2 fold immunity protein
VSECSDKEAKWHVDAISWLKGGIIGTAEVALKFAEIVLEYTQGKEELEEQRPLIVKDQGTTWRVEGSWNPDAREMELAKGRWRMVVKKHDAQIIDIGTPAFVKLSPEVEARVRKIRRLQADADKQKK